MLNKQDKRFRIVTALLYKEMQTAFLLIRCLLCMRSCWIVLSKFDSHFLLIWLLSVLQLYLELRLSNITVFVIILSSSIALLCTFAWNTLTIHWQHDYTMRRWWFCDSKFSWLRSNRNNRTFRSSNSQLILEEISILHIISCHDMTRYDMIIISYHMHISYISYKNCF